MVSGLGLPRHRRPTDRSRGLLCLVDCQLQCERIRAIVGALLLPEVFCPGFRLSSKRRHDVNVHLEVGIKGRADAVFATRALEVDSG